MCTVFILLPGHRTFLCDLPLPARTTELGYKWLFVFLKLSPSVFFVTGFNPLSQWQQLTIYLLAVQYVETSSLFNIDNKSEQRVCPSRYTGYHLCLLISWLVFIVLNYPQSLRNLTVGCYFPILINTCQIFCPASLYSFQVRFQF